MKKTILRKTGSRIVAVLLVMATLLSLSITAFAATSVSTVSCQPNNPNGGQSSYFYIKATGTSCKLKFTLSKGYLDFGNLCANSVYGTYQIKIQKWDTAKKCVTGSLVLDQDIYKSNAASSTFTTNAFKTAKNSYYRVQVYFWAATTTASSYYKNYGYGGSNAYGVPNKPNHECNASWRTLPSIKAQNASNCILYNTCP